MARYNTLHAGSGRSKSVLLTNGFEREEVIVAHPDCLDKVVGPNTKVLAITETDPLGMAPATSTFTQVFSGATYMNVKFKQILNHPAVRIISQRSLLVDLARGSWEKARSEKNWG